MSSILHQINAGGVTNGFNAIASPFINVYNDQQHFGYRDSSDRIWDAWFNPQNNSWNLQQINLNVRTNGPTAVAGPCIGKFNNQQHYAYVDGQGAVWDSWYDGDHNKWNLQQLNMGGRTSGPAAKPGFAGKDLGPVSIWVDPSGSQQHFTYLGTDSAVYDAFWDSNSNTWKLQKLNGGGKTNGPLAASSPFGCVFHNQQHIAYLDSAGNIHDSWYDGSGHWSVQKIGGQSATSYQVFVWVDPKDTQQHFTYLGTDGGVYDAYWDSSLNNWEAQKINAHGNTAGPAAAGMPMACVFGDEEHIGYLDGAGNVWDAWRNAAGNWNLQQVPIGPAAKDLAFVWTDAAHTHLHFTYRDSTGVIWDAIPSTGTTARFPIHTGGVLLSAKNLR
jgi:hypothetical protein